MNELVLDAWALMVWLKAQQPAASRVRALLDRAGRGECKLVMSIVNLGEVFYLTAKAKNVKYAQGVLETLRPLIMTESATNELVMAAATLKARYAISYADGFAAATAIARDVPLVTGDTELRAVAATEKAVKLEWIGD